MSRKNRKVVVRKQPRKIADSRRVRFGAGMAPATIVRSQDPATANAGKVRFGAGMAPAALRK